MKALILALAMLLPAGHAYGFWLHNPHVQPVPCPPTTCVHEPPGEGPGPVL